MFLLGIAALVHCVCAFEYLSATVHSQDVKSIPKRVPWHPHLYLAQDSSGGHYELRHSNSYYDVSISFLETRESAPGVLNCECRFVKEELEEDNTGFLQVTKAGSKNEDTTKEINIGARKVESPNGFVQRGKSEAEASEFLQKSPQKPQPAQMLQEVPSYSQRPQEMPSYLQRPQEMPSYPAYPQMVQEPPGYPQMVQEAPYYLPQPAYQPYEPIIERPVYERGLFKRPYYTQSSFYEKPKVLFYQPYLQ